MRFRLLPALLAALLLAGAARAETVETGATPLLDMPFTDLLVAKWPAAEFQVAFVFKDGIDVNVVDFARRAEYNVRLDRDGGTATLRTNPIVRPVPKDAVREFPGAEVSADGSFRVASWPEAGVTFRCGSPGEDVEEYEIEDASGGCRYAVERRLKENAVSARIERK